MNRRERGKREDHPPKHPKKFQFLCENVGGDNGSAVNSFGKEGNKEGRSVSPFFSAISELD